MAQVGSIEGKPAEVGGRLNVKGADLWGRSFYFWMSLLVTVVVIYGFGQTVNERLIHPATPRPAILYLHAALFTGWLAFFILQSALVQTRNVKLHRKLGWFGGAMGVAIPIVGIATAIVMTRMRLHEGSKDAAQFMIVPFWDMVSFTTTFALAFYWRTKPEFHRRLMLLATCALTAAAFGRFPWPLMRDVWFYAGVDGLILLGVLRDLLLTKRVHPVYLYGLPLLMLGQTTVVYISLNSVPAWMRIAHAILG
jgi:hypothetical protein